MERTSPPRHLLIEAAVRALVDPVFVLDREGRYLEAFGGTDRDAYDSPDYLVGKTLHELMASKQADAFLDNAWSGRSSTSAAASSSKPNCKGSPPAMT